jgi:hypothetical protein
MATEDRWFVTEAADLFQLGLLLSIDVVCVRISEVLAEKRRHLALIPLNHETKQPAMEVVRVKTCYGELATAEQWRRPLEPECENVSCTWDAPGIGTFKDTEKYIISSLIGRVTVEHHADEPFVALDGGLRSTGEGLQLYKRYFGLRVLIRSRISSAPRTGSV